MKLQLFHLKAKVSLKAGIRNSFIYYLRRLKTTNLGGRGGSKPPKGFYGLRENFRRKIKDESQNLFKERRRSKVGLKEYLKGFCDRSKWKFWFLREKKNLISVVFLQIIGFDEGKDCDRSLWREIIRLDGKHDRCKYYFAFKQ